MMSDFLILKRVKLKSVHKRTGKTRHYRDDMELPAASVLKVVKIGDEKGYYLIHFDSEDKEIVDTLHDSMEEALAQAEWEYGVAPTEWEDVDSRH